MGVVEFSKEYGIWDKRVKGKKEMRVLHWSELEVFKKAHELTLEIYRLTEHYPKTELFGITSQLRRAAFSVTVNIVEGKSRKSSKEWIQFLNVSNASLEEVRYFLLLSKDLKYISSEQYSDLEANCVIISKMLNSLINTLRQKVKDGKK